MYTKSDTVNKARASERNADFLCRKRQLQPSTQRIWCRNTPGQPSATMDQVSVRGFGEDSEEFPDGPVVVGREGAGDDVLELSDRVSGYETRHG